MRGMSMAADHSPRKTSTRSCGTSGLLDERDGKASEAGRGAGRGGPLSGSFPWRSYRMG